MQIYATWASSSLIFLKNRDKCTVVLFPCKIVLSNKGEREQHLAEPNMHILNMQYMQKHTWNAQYAKAYQICNICKKHTNICKICNKYTKYATYAKTSNICNICKNIPNMQNMQ